MINVLFFASLRELLETDRAQLEAGNLTQVGELRQALMEAHPEWQTALDDRRLLIAVNQAMAREETPVRDGDEVAFFPPVTGG